MARELLGADVRLQAAACREYVSRGGDVWLWFESKALDPADRAAVWREIGRQDSAVRMSPRGRVYER